MAAHSRSVPIPWGALLFALLGLAWCGYIAFPTGNPAPCATSGCALFRDLRIFGISMWWIGGAYFFLLAFLCLRGKQYLAWNLARVALVADTILLAIMLFSAPCFDCLVIACFFCLTLLLLRPTPSMWFSGQPAKLLVLPLWIGLFISNACLVVNETMPLWALGNKENKSVAIYFSPSCPSCRDALLSFGTSVALYPIAEKAGDEDAILRLSSLLDTGTPLQEALTRSLNPNEPLPKTSLTSDMMLSIRLMRNKAAVLRQGYQSLPLIQINGMPKSWIPQPSTAQASPAMPHDIMNEDQPAITPRTTTTQGAQPAQSAAGLPWDDSALGQCGQDTAKPCE